MKKFLKIFLPLLALAIIGIGGYIAWSWYSLDETAVPSPTLLIEGEQQTANKMNWKVPIALGFLEREFEKTNENNNTFNLEADKLSIKFDESYNYQVTVKNSEDELFNGDAEEYSSFVFPQNGSYTVDITVAVPKEDTTPYGIFSYSVNAVVDVPPPPPVLRMTSTKVVQGDTVAVELENIPDGVIPTIETDLCPAVFMNTGEGKWVAYVGVADSREAGEYNIKMTFGDTEKVIPVSVTTGSFNRQDLTINTSSPAISEANSPAAYAQYRESIPPFYETTDENLYWDGNFIQPVEGRLTSEYGLLRYTNGNPTPRRHAGIDLATPEGTPIVAPANGKVVFSKRLLNTGNTIVIEHGGGLKTYYFHLVELGVEVGQLVTQGENIGKVGTTGYSTGPHLHFEIRIGSQNLDPFKFFSGTGGCFSSKSEVEL